MDVACETDQQLINGECTTHLHVKEFNDSLLCWFLCIYRQLDAIIISSLKKPTLTLSYAFHPVRSA